jgi:hypothetical protein
MRKWLVLFLMLMMPLQLTWAATSAYCQHENGLSVQHVGHHGQQHFAQSDERASADQTQLAALDLDCGTCHAGCAISVASALGHSVAPTSTAIAPGTERQLKSPPLKVPDRPQWISLS